MQETFDALRTVMLNNAPDLVVTKDQAGDLQLETAWKDPRKPKQAVWFGGVKLGKAYVSYHLMPVYSEAGLAASIPEVLRKRQQGKSCFNFKTIDAEQAEALATLTAACALAYSKPPES